MQLIESQQTAQSLANVICGAFSGQEVPAKFPPYRMDCQCYESIQTAWLEDTTRATSALTLCNTVKPGQIRVLNNVKQGELEQ